MTRKSGVLLLALAVGCSSGGNDPSDGNPPQLAITSPQANANVSGQVPIEITAIDDFGVDEVRILVDGVLLTRIFTPPFRAVWNTTPLDNNSPHVIRVEALDLARNLSSRQISVTVVKGPS